MQYLEQAFNLNNKESSPNSNSESNKALDNKDNNTMILDYYQELG